MNKQKNLKDIEQTANLDVQNWKLAYANKMIVLVEAKANEILFRKLLHKNCKFFALQGWVKVEQTLKNAIPYKLHNIIAIIDADFKRITNYECAENLFLTDFHDTEIMLAHSEAWENVLNQYCDLEKLAKFEQKNGNLLVFLLKLLKPLSVLRFLKEKYNQNWIFRTQKEEKYDYLKYKEFIDTEKLNLDIQKMLKTIENKSNLPNYFKNNPNYTAELETLNKKDIDLKEYTNGHDLMNVLSIALEKVISNKANKGSVTGEELEKTLSIAYRLSDFETTQLCSALKNWQNKYTHFKLL
jgi:hypothetical protein